MNPNKLNTLLDGLWDDYRTGQCRNCKNEEPYWTTARLIKLENAWADNEILIELKRLRHSLLSNKDDWRGITAHLINLVEHRGEQQDAHSESEDL